MDVIDKIKFFFAPSLELTLKDYYEKHLKPNDAALLYKFLPFFGGSLPFRAHIVAVGSSTFPLQYWNDRRKLAKAHPEKNIAISYRDIDLLVLPDRILPLSELERGVQDSLWKFGYEGQRHDNTIMGGVDPQVIYGTHDEESPQYVKLEYGTHSISTTLESGTKVDFILGREDMKKPAFRKIEEERDSKRPFAVLYPYP